MREDHEEQHARLEREAADMKRMGDSVGEEIDDARETWASRQTDASVPGATGEPRDREAEAPWEDE